MGQPIYTNEQEIIINLNHNLNFKHSILVTVMVMVIVRFKKLLNSYPP